MDQQQFKLWIAELPTLTSTQLDELSTRFKLLSRTAVAEHKGKSDFGVRVLQAIVDVMKKNNVETTTVNVLKRSSAYVSSTAKIENLRIFLESISLSKLVQDQILRVGIELLFYDLLNWQGFAISSHTLLNQIYRIPSTLNKNFPGYAASGILVKIVKGQ